MFSVFHCGCESHNLGGQLQLMFLFSDLLPLEYYYGLAVQTAGWWYSKWNFHIAVITIINNRMASISIIYASHPY